MKVNRYKKRTYCIIPFFCGILEQAKLIYGDRNQISGCFLRKAVSGMMKMYYFTIRYYFTPVGMAIKNQSINNKCWQGCGEKGTLVYRWWECRLVQPLQKTVWNFLKNLKLELPFDLVIPMLRLYLKNPESPVQKNLCTPMFIAVLFTITKCWKQCPSVNEWIKKLLYIYTMEYYVAERKKELLSFVTTWKELESIMPSKISQVVKDKYHMISPMSRT